MKGVAQVFQRRGSSGPELLTHCHSDTRTHFPFKMLLPTPVPTSSLFVLKDALHTALLTPAPRGFGLPRLALALTQCERHAGRVPRADAVRDGQEGQPWVRDREGGVRRPGLLGPWVARDRGKACGSLCE